MTAPDPFWPRAYEARDKLVAQFLDHPDVSLIDIGYDLENKATPQQIVLRVHIRRPSAKQTLALPPEIDGLPVRTIVADYGIE